MRTAAYKVGVASVYVSLRSLLDERHWRSATPQAQERAEAHSLFIFVQSQAVIEKQRSVILA